jgi:hypothetical protein
MTYIDVLTLRLRKWFGFHNDVFTELEALAYSVWFAAFHISITDSYGAQAPPDRRVGGGGQIGNDRQGQLCLVFKL